MKTSMSYQDPDDEVLRQRSAWIIDLDGVVYAWAELLPGAGEATARLRAAGRKVALLTNNSARVGGRGPQARGPREYRVAQRNC